MTMLLVMLGAAVGAPSRWLIDQGVQSRVGRAFPLGTLTINVLGSGVLGLVLGAASQGAASTAVVALVGVGFCGGFTTYSTFGFETVRLGQEGHGRAAVAYVLLSLALGLGAVVAGWELAHRLW